MAEPFRVSVTGIDGAGKDSVTLDALQQLSADGLKVTKTSRPYYRAVAGEVTEIYPTVKGITDVAHRFADRTRNRHIVGSVNALNTMLQSRVMEPLAMALYPDTDVIASARDLRIDPAVYSGYYFRDIRRAADPATLVGTMARLTGINRDMIVWLQVDPEVAVERIAGRIEAEAKERRGNDGQSGVMREKWAHMHENVASLQLLANRYEGALRHLTEIRPDTELVTVDTTELNRQQVGQMVYEAISKAIKTKALHGTDIQTYPAAA